MSGNERSTVAYDGVIFAPGATFRVVRDGLSLSGMVYAGRSAWGGWKQDLHVGDTLTCTGFGRGWGGDPGYGVEFTTEASQTAGATHCDAHPAAGGVWSYHPAPGYLEPMPDEGARS